jgi:hypothetical protein
MRNNPGPPMTLANMRENGVRAVTATCEACGREADVNVDALPEMICSKSSRSDTAADRRSSHPSCPCLPGTRLLGTPLTPTQSWTGSSTMRMASS